MAACALASATVCAMPTKRELAEAQGPVAARMAQDLRAFAAGTKTAAETFAALRNRAAEAEKESVRYLLLQGAFKIAARDGDYDAAADILNQMQREITDIPHAVIVELVEGETRTLAPGCAPQLTAFLHEPPPERTFKFGRDVDIPLHNGGKMEFVACPAGTFRMGRMGDRDPKSPLYEHAVTISRPFWIGRFPVTVEQWTNVMGRVELSEAQRAVGPRMPINRNRYAIEALAKTLTRMAEDRLPPGYVVRLPTEAEWEYALRAKSSDRNDPHAWYRGGGRGFSEEEMKKYRMSVKDLAASIGRSGMKLEKVFAPVGEHLPNAWGCHDFLHPIGIYETVLDTVSAAECAGYEFKADRKGYFFTEGEVDPLRYAGRPQYGKVHILLLDGYQKLHSSLNHPKTVFRLAIGPDLLNEHGKSPTTRP